MQGWKNFQPFLLPLNYGKISKIRFGRKKYFLLVFKKKYFEQQKFQKLFLKNHSYEVFDIENLQNIPEIFQTENLVGLNVTIPYKEQIIPYLDELSEEAQEISHQLYFHQNGKNKKVSILMHLDLKKHFSAQKTTPKSAIVLGNGGAAKAVQFVLKRIIFRLLPFLELRNQLSESH